MTSLLWYVIPIAFAIALSTLPIVAVLILLLSPNAIARSVPFAVGLASGLAVLVTSVSVGAGLVPTAVTDALPPWVHAAEVVLGAVLIVVTLIISRRPSSSKSLDPSRAMARLTPARAFGFGVLMNLRPKNLILAVAAGVAFGAAPIDPGDVALAVGVFVGVGTSVVIGLIVTYAIGRRRVQSALERLRGFLVTHASSALRVIMGVVGVVLVIVGTVQLVSL